MFIWKSRLLMVADITSAPAYLFTLRIHPEHFVAQCWGLLDWTNERRLFLNVFMAGLSAVEWRALTPEPQVYKLPVGFRASLPLPFFLLIFSSRHVKVDWGRVL